ncbi:hypothetical protein SAMN04487890_11154 [Mucilaginibacter polytrichastri]|nr:hypothetical protein SAMN04487890_11154 [Mucilaginibacter polytrichastri]
MSLYIAMVITSMQISTIFAPKIQYDQKNTPTSTLPCILYNR